MKNTGNFEGQDRQNSSNEFNGLNYWVNPNVGNVSGAQRDSLEIDPNENEATNEENNQYANLSKATGHYPVETIPQEEPFKNKDMPTYFLEYDLDKLDFMD
ncbi:hypothetical protein [Pedobacter montanisoli]|uniref:Uncharacterized protein n=1 Tax=Pedobacter montanisoli TaxID=2923277 RepID=A0ABS9ZYP5_9SPHI|nr:hypothetical protein [Pedobacter montanisoli]MCJ0743407.1 hypothetical protein [Pedobacter montanisoli]